MSITIGFDGKFLPGDAGSGALSGNGVHSRELIQHLLEIDHANNYRVYLPGLQDSESYPSNCTTVQLPRYARSSTLRNTFAYAWELHRRPVDVLLSFYHVPMGVKCRTVLLLADVFWLAHADWLPKRMAIPRTISVKRSVAAADRIITTTQFSRSEIVRLLGVPESKISVVPHGIRTNFQKKSTPEIIEAVKQKLGTGDNYVLSVNDIHPRKNLVGLIEAFGLVKARTGIPHKLVLAGRTLWDYPEFFAAVAQSAWSDDIIVTGYIASEDVAPLYHGAQLFMYPSFYEGWGLQVHEAMSAGIPIAIANNTTMPEISGGAAAEFDPHNVEEMADCMERILSDGELRSEMTRKGHEQVKNFSWESAARKTLAACLE
ncbi:MAG: glycosyltransferase involved in cell wall biosynthesis [Gammaproteobacteria bacterium]|jgi:glycosyltransferase involved in cell wall biosynthesis